MSYHNQKNISKKRKFAEISQANEKNYETDFGRTKKRKLNEDEVEGRGKSQKSPKKS